MLTWLKEFLFGTKEELKKPVVTPDVGVKPKKMGGQRPGIKTRKKKTVKK